jgi:hypothetical protein
VANTTSLVIDASIARASGQETAKATSAVSCRKFMNTVLACGHSAVMNSLTKDEWKKHRSRFATQWQVSIFARKRIVFLKSDSDETLRKQVSSLIKDEAQKKAALKDCHLIESALETEKKIASLDEKSRAIFREIAQSLSTVGRICWVNPDNPAENSLDWLQCGAPADRKRCLRVD